MATIGDLANGTFDRRASCMRFASYRYPNLALDIEVSNCVDLGCIGDLIHNDTNMQAYTVKFN